MKLKKVMNVMETFGISKMDDYNIYPYDENRTPSTYYGKSSKRQVSLMLSNGDIKNLTKEDNVKQLAKNKDVIALFVEQTYMRDGKSNYKNLILIK